MSTVSMPARRPVAEESHGPFWILATAIGAVIVTVVTVLALHGSGAEGLGLITRYLARLAFPFFLAAFSGSALAELAPSKTSFWLLSHRRWLGLGFATVMFVHLLAIIAFISMRDEAFEVGLTQILGGIGFVFIAFMAATSNDGAVRALGRARWSRLHRFCLYYLWFIITATYLGAAARDPWHALGGAIAFAALGLRIAAWRHRRRRPDRGACL
jgi:DMSO/TMAO reductase YedYZ heme-binding membrane subunit